MSSLVSSLNMDVVLKILAPRQPITLHLTKSLCIFGCHCTDSCFCPLSSGDEALDFNQLDPITLVSTIVLTNLWRTSWCLVKDPCLVVPATIYHILQKSTPEFLNLSTVGLLGLVILHCGWLTYVLLGCLAGSARCWKHFSLLL